MSAHLVNRPDDRIVVTVDATKIGLGLADVIRRKLEQLVFIKTVTLKLIDTQREKCKPSRNSVLALIAGLVGSGVTTAIG